MTNFFKKPVLASLLIFLAGLLIGAGAVYFLINRAVPPSVRLVRQSDVSGVAQYSFINPLLNVSIPRQVGLRERADLRKHLETLISTEKNAANSSSVLMNGNASSTLPINVVSVYYKDLNSGDWIAINESEKYAPASLFKVPVMMAYYQLAQQDPSILTKKILYDGSFSDQNDRKTFRSENAISVGNTYTIGELIEYMIKYSDNNATWLLNENMNFDLQAEVFRDLGVADIRNKKAEEDIVTARSFSLFFSVLYNATYLGRDFSEKALKLLSESDFIKGIRAGVPGDIAVAQKFGEFSLLSSDGSLTKRELNMCSIVYLAKHPYILCVMAKGTDFSKLEQMIANVSKMVFQEAAN